jgi:hypothetical protein
MIAPRIDWRYKFTAKSALNGNDQFYDAGFGDTAADGLESWSIIFVHLSGWLWDKGLGREWYHLTLTDCPRRYQRCDTCISAARHGIMVSQVDGTTVRWEVNLDDINFLTRASQGQDVESESQKVFCITLRWEVDPRDVNVLTCASRW